MTGQTDTDALRARLGKGARFDAANAPADDLLLARRGAAYFARQLNGLSDAGLRQPSRRTGASRAQIVAEVSYQARALAIALGALSRTLSQEELDWRPDITLALSMPPHALRYLYAHSDVHLNVEFRDLDADNWAGVIPLEGADLPVAQAPERRARRIWTAAYDLGAGARLGEVPAEFQSYVAEQDGRE